MYHLPSVFSLITGKFTNCLCSANIISNVGSCGDGLRKKKSKLNETRILVQICKGRCFFFFDLELKHTLFYYYFGKFVLRKDWNFCDKILQAVAILNKQDKSFHLYIFNFFQIFKKLYQFEMNKKLYFRHISKMHRKVTGIIKVAVKTASIMSNKKRRRTMESIRIHYGIHYRISIQFYILWFGYSKYSLWKMKRLHEGVLRMKCNDSKSSFDKSFSKDGSLIRHHRN